MAGSDLIQHNSIYSNSWQKTMSSCQFCRKYQSVTLESVTCITGQFST